jgi:uncharacterized protein (TIGR00369 family)
MHEPQERHYAYETGIIGPELLKELSGLEVMQRLLAGDLPMAAIASTLDFRLALVEPGRVVVEAAPQRFVYNMFGAAHGGYAATLLDSCLGCAVCTMVPRGSGYTTVDLTINYIRPIRTDAGLIRAEGLALHVGRRTATAEAKLLAADGKLLAHGVTTCLVFDL